MLPIAIVVMPLGGLLVISWIVLCTYVYKYRKQANTQPTNQSSNQVEKDENIQWAEMVLGPFLHSPWWQNVAWWVSALVSMVGWLGVCYHPKP